VGENAPAKARLVRTRTYQPKFFVRLKKSASSQVYNSTILEETDKNPDARAKRAVTLCPSIFYSKVSGGYTRDVTRN
jgi:hypothetical protein